MHEKFGRPALFYATLENIDSLKVPMSSKFLFSHLILYSTQWTLAKEVFDLDKKRSLYEVLKPENPVLLRSTSAADHIIDVLRFVT